MDKNFKIRGLKSSESELFVLPTTDRSVGEAGEKKCLLMWDFGNREDIEKRANKTNTNNPCVTPWRFPVLKGCKQTGQIPNLHLSWHSLFVKKGWIMDTRGNSSQGIFFQSLPSDTLMMENFFWDFINFPPHLSDLLLYISSVGNISWFYHQYLDIFLSNFMKIFVFLQNIWSHFPVKSHK